VLAFSIDPKLIDPNRYQTIGMVSAIVASQPYSIEKLDRLIVDEVVPAYRHGCLKIFFDMDQVPVGFVTWAWLSAETEARLLQTMDPWIHLSEWTEGSTLWIRCFLTPPQQRIRAMSLCMRELFPRVDRARTLAVRKGAMMALEFDRPYLARLVRKTASHWAKI
jgi:hemolysin-activating ACP:hemolysin acyltransferase